MFLKTKLYHLFERKNGCIKFCFLVGDLSSHSVYLGIALMFGIDVIDVMNQEHMNRQGKKEHSASVHPVSNHTSKRALYGLLMLWTIAYCATMDSQA